MNTNVTEDFLLQRRLDRKTPDVVRQMCTGFVLIEVMVSSCVLILLASLSMAYAAQVYLQTTKLLHKGTQAVQMQVALDVLVRDLLQAPVRKAAWKAQASHHVWTTPSGDVGFENTDHGIVRSNGLFDTKKQRWIRRTQSFFPPGLSYALEPINQDEQSIYLLAVTITAADKQCATTRVAMRSGVCL